MGSYNLSKEEILDKFEKFLLDTSLGEGDIMATTIAAAWNKLAYKHKWCDRLVAVPNVHDLKTPPWS